MKIRNNVNEKSAQKALKIAVTLYTIINNLTKAQIFFIILIR